MVEYLLSAHLAMVQRGYEEEAVEQQVVFALLDDEHDAAGPLLPPGAADRSAAGSSTQRCRFAP
ncbi:hypothetical protein [Rhodosalinus sediminis]|uniref:hypothetical protein n=1 Tax=Rhodosalinus sediminis TaxID=1940533 RepID=UPI001313E4E0|nr:hypothetical protein [Rhodosalinus sediminis]